MGNFQAIGNFSSWHWTSLLSLWSNPCPVWFLSVKRVSLSYLTVSSLFMPSAAEGHLHLGIFQEGQEDANTVLWIQRRHVWEVEGPHCQPVKFWLKLHPIFTPSYWLVGGKHHSRGISTSAPSVLSLLTSCFSGWTNSVSISTNASSWLMLTISFPTGS